MKKRNLKAVITIFTLLLCFGVYAQGPPGGGQGRGGMQGQRGGQPDASEILSKLDANNDDVIDKDEASKDSRGKISEDFDEIDTNDDELIDLEELKDSLNNRKSNKRPKRVSPEKLIKQVDDNGDGTLNELEVAAKDIRQLSNDFNEIDTNQDNEIDLEELKSFYAKDDKPKRKERDLK